MAEGNQLMKTLFEIFGTVPALIISKVFCCLAVLTIGYLATYANWLKGALVGLSGFYLMNAIIPWTNILA